MSRRCVAVGVLTLQLAVPATAMATRQAWRIQGVSAVATLHTVASHPPTCAAALAPSNPDQTPPPDKSIIAGDYVVSMRAIGDNSSQAVQYNGFIGPNSQQPLRFKATLTSTITETYRDLVQGPDASGKFTCREVDRTCHATTTKPSSSFVRVQTTGSHSDLTHLARRVGVFWSSVVNRLVFRSCRSSAYGGPLAPDLNDVFKAPIQPAYPTRLFFGARQRLPWHLARSLNGVAGADAQRPRITGQLTYRGELKLHKSTLPFSCKDHISHSGFVCDMR